MDQIAGFFEQMFKANSWPARWHCGKWTDFHGWLYICSDLAIWAAYFVIPLFLIRILKKKPGGPLPIVLWLFVAFILFCGLTHLMDALMFWWPAYRLSAAVRFATAVISWVTVVMVYKLLPVLSSLKTSGDLEAELLKRKKSETKFMGLLESAPDAMIITSSNGKVLMVNAQAEEVFGYGRGEIIGKEVEVLVPERFRQKHSSHRHGYVQNPKVRGMGVGMDLYGKRKNGSEFPVEISLSPMKIENEGVIIISAIRDITKQKGAEAEIKKLNENLEQLVIERTARLELALENEKAARQEMQENQSRLTLLTEASEILASSLDYEDTLANLARIITPNIADWCAIDEVTEDGSVKRITVSHVNPEKIKWAYEVEAKYPSDPASGRGAYQVIRTHEPELYPTIPDELLVASAKSEEHLQMLRELGIKSAVIAPLLNRDKIYGAISLVLAESGKHYDEKDLEFVRELARRAALAIENAKLYKKSQDINTELEQRVVKRTLELEAINKELEAFSYSVSHDLRAPLRSIDGFSNKILKDYAGLLDEQGRDYFTRVKNASQRMGYLIDDLLKLSRLSRVEMHKEAANLSEIAELVIAECKASDPERNVSFSIKPDLVAMVDRSLMRIALQNLIGNAWKYSKNQPEARIEFGSFLLDKQTVYYVRDNGAGFNMRYVDKLFGAFQRLHGSLEFEGNGIGLATVQRIVRRHQGAIWAEGEVNKGATFFFTL